MPGHFGRTAGTTGNHRSNLMRFDLSTGFFLFSRAEDWTNTLARDDER